MTRLTKQDLHGIRHNAKPQWGVSRTSPLGVSRLFTIHTEVSCLRWFERIELLSYTDYPSTFLEHGVEGVSKRFGFA